MSPTWKTAVPSSCESIIAGPTCTTVPGGDSSVPADEGGVPSWCGPDEINLPRSTDHHGNWLVCIKSRQLPLAPVEVGHRACSACLLHHIAMRAKRKLYWDPLTERFRNDDAANALLSRPQRPPYVLA